MVSFFVVPTLLVHTLPFLPFLFFSFCQSCEFVSVSWKDKMEKERNGIHVIFMFLFLENRVGRVWKNSCFFFFFFSFFSFFLFLFFFFFSFLFLFLFSFSFSFSLSFLSFLFISYFLKQIHLCIVQCFFFSCRIKLLNVITHHTSHWHRFVTQKERGERRERKRVHLYVGYCVVMCWVLRVWIIVRWWNRRGEGWMILKLKNKEMIKRRRGIPKDWARFYCRYFTEEAWLVRGQHNTTAGSILMSWDNLTCCVCASNNLLLWAAGTYDRQTTGLLWDDCLI